MSSVRTVAGLVNTRPKRQRARRGAVTWHNALSMLRLKLLIFLSG
ncbi:MAG: hypothetical protein SF029_16130 [bacterium]|nr:hypothetical protein [bacterium]